MNKRATLLVVLMGCGWLAGAFPAHAAEGAPAPVARVIQAQGVVEQGSDAQPGWTPVTPPAFLSAQATIRTGEQSRAALILADETQIRLHQNTVLRIGDVASPRSPLTQLALLIGRAWTQTLRPPQRALNMHTPTATIGIRGTDWDVEVAPDGQTLITVFSGEVSFGNDLGQLTLTRNEAARAERGKPPVKLVLTRPRDRIQWVNALAPEPRRFVDAQGQALPAARWLIEADRHIAQGDPEAALAVLHAGLQVRPTDPDLRAQTARALILSDRTDEAVQWLGAPADGTSDPVELWLMRGLLAHRQGLPGPTLAAYQQAVNLAPGDDRAWYGLGRAQTEREDTHPARASLWRALDIQAHGPGYRGELATLETFSNRFEEAESAFAQALADNPTDYVALTGLGLLRLKQGQATAALEVLLQAGTLEPRYARAKTYTGVAYWQLGRATDAIRMLNAAAELDDHDPVPHLLLSQIHVDRFDAAEAVAASRRAVVRMPYLKSLNQLSNDQQGRANLGAALAFFGLEEWALELAQQSHQGDWGGSHLFLADRYNGEFSKNARLFQGFLSDPLAFGANPHQTTLLPSPGIHGALELQRDLNGYRMSSPSVTLNGLTHPGMPVAFYAKAQRALAPGQALPAAALIDPGLTAAHEQQARDLYGADSEGSLQATLGTLAMGLRPTEQLGVFGYWNRNRIGLASDHAVHPVGLFDPDATVFPRIRQDVQQGLLGLSQRWAPGHTTWMLWGHRHQTLDLQGIPALRLTPTAFATLAVDQQQDQRSDEFHLRHQLDLGPATRLQLGWEWSQERQTSHALGLGQYVGLQPPTLQLLLTRLDNDFVRQHGSLHVGLTHQASAAWQLEGQLASHHLRLDASPDSVRRELVVDPLNTTAPVTLREESLASHQRRHPLTPRLGLVFRPSEMFSLRMAHQDWIRPLGVGSLDTTETAGLPLDDTLVQAGGRSRQNTVQATWNPDDQSLLLARLSHIRVDNPDVNGLTLQTPTEYFLSELRNTQVINLSSLPLQEDTPVFRAGTVRQATLAWNRLLSPRLSVYARWVGRDSTQPDGRWVPYTPRQTWVLGGTWTSPSRIYLSGRLVHRSLRYADEANRQPLAAGWHLDVAAFVESADKRWLLAVGALNLGGRETAPSLHRYVANLRYRF